jgi:hypothetical protein
MAKYPQAPPFQAADQRGNEMKTLLLLVGIIVCAAGILFAGQGLGYINWPASSFMISEMKWVYYGGGIAVVGILLIVIALR